MLQRGEDVMFGVGIESVRGTGVAPQVWIPGRTPSGIAPVIDKVAVRETRGSKFASHSSEIVMKRNEGDLEFNVRAISLGYILLSLLGSVSSVTKSGETAVYEHTFSVLPEDPEHPSLTLALNQPAGQSYRYLKALVTMLSLEVAPNDLVKGTASFIAPTEQAVSEYSNPDPLTADVFYRHQDVSIKMAANVAGLGAATPIKVKSIKTDIPNGGRFDQNVSELEPGNTLATTFEPKVSIELDYQNEDLHDGFKDGDYFALQITLNRADVAIGVGSTPKAVFTFPRVSIEKWTPNRPIDDVMKEAIDFTVHFDETSSSGIGAILTNTLAEYDSVTS